MCVCYPNCSLVGVGYGRGGVKEIEISICTFQGGSFDVMFKDPATNHEYTFSGEIPGGKMLDDDFAFVDSIAPACVWTKYKRVDP